MPEPIAAVGPDGQVLNHCPFGCQTSKLDEFGYCPHLLGFTNDGEVYEPVEKVYGRGRNDMPEWTGRYRVRGDLEDMIPEGSKLVNPEYQQLVDGIWRTAKKWVSARVYSPKPREDKMPAKELAHGR